MIKPAPAKERLLSAATELFWTRGYSNVSVRDIAGAAGVDAALVSRYFGGKRGLFMATLSDIKPWDALNADEGALLAQAVASFSHPFDPETEQVNPFTMLMTNVTDPEMGDSIREMVRDGLSAPLAARLNGPDAENRAALLLSVLFGMALMRKNFQLSALTELPPDELSAQTMALAKSALSYRLNHRKTPDQ